MNKLYEVLETCLDEIEQGADVDTVLFRYPDHSAELRPILETAVKAKAMAVSVPSQDVVRRNRAKLLQHAAQLREQKNAPVARRIWSVPLRRSLVTLMVIAMLFVSGNGLVRASSATLPGDNLYPVKRTWENFRLFLTVNVDERDALEFEFENERLEELNELFAQGRDVEVEFSGYVTRQRGDEWRISGVTVLVSPQTRLPAQPVDIGAAVRVKGLVQAGNFVAADEIRLLPPGTKLPEIKDRELGIEDDEVENSNQQIDIEPVSGSDNEAPKPKATPTPVPTSKPEPKKESIEGSVISIENKFIVVNGVVMDISKAEVKGTPKVGAIVKAEGYFDANGIFIVTKIEFKVVTSGGSGGSTNSNTNDDANNGSDDNKNNNDNDSDDDNTNNTNDNSNNGDDD